MTIFQVPKSVFVPLEFDTQTRKWSKRDDLPRFREPEEAAQYIVDHPTLFHKDGKPVFIQWQERDEAVLIKEYLQGVGTLEWLSLRH
jgi:hypothetical protein